jgi:hypothetical protein
VEWIEESSRSTALDLGKVVPVAEAAGTVLVPGEDHCSIPDSGADILTYS